MPVQIRADKSASLRFQSVFRGIRWQMQHDRYRRFVSEQTESAGLSGNLNHGSNLRISGLLPVFKNTPFSLKLDHLSNEDGIDRVEWRGRVTKNISKLRITSDVTQVIESDRERTTDLNLQVSSRYQNLSVRGALSYGIEPESVLKNVSLNTDWKIDKKSVVRLGVRRSGSVDPVHTITVGASHNFDPAKLGLNVSYNDDDEIRALLSSSFSLGYDPYKKGPFMRHESLTEKAMFAPRVYYDKNNNAIFDGDDEWMEDISFAGSGVDRTVKTNKEGYALLSGVRPYARGSFTLDPSSLSDPFMRSTVDTHDYILRPGQTVQKDFPVVLVGEVDGDIMVIENGKEKPAQSIIVQILGKDGTVIQEGKSEYDGFVWVQDIPMGTYTARIKLEQMEELGYCLPEQQNITLNADEPFMSLNPVTLWPQQSDGQVNIVLAQSPSVEAAKDIWFNIRPQLETVFLDFDQFPFSYIVSKENSSEDQVFELMLHNIEEADAAMLCDALTEEGLSCNIPEDHALCPSTIVEIEQIDNAGFFDDAISEDHLLDDVMKDELINIIGN